MEALRIILFGLGAAIAYGILHDQVTAHLCVEYFTIAHPPVFPTESPFLLAIGWGVLATWWVGLPLGLMLAVAARLGRGNRLGLADLRPAILRLLGAMALCAIAAGAWGAWSVASGRSPVPGGWGPLLPAEIHVAFSAAAWAHLASYASGILGGLAVIAWTVWRRLTAAPSGRA
ncbi:hypothetical protein [Inquilinus sp.]|uniref:hypothetical protein n=1 Tax=Inquilinus sp. TaxID=1932117 RepID=UPI0031E263C6